jgi:hypothetical protein
MKNKQIDEFDINKYMRADPFFVALDIVKILNSNCQDTTHIVEVLNKTMDILKESSYEDIGKIEFTYQ